jgi:GDP-L-fucose synthase
VIAADAAFEDTVVNCASNVPVTIGTCARVILDALDWDAEIVRAPDTYHGVEFKSLDSSRFLAATGWQPQIPLAIGVRRVLAADFAGVVP